ncbi:MULTISPECIES: response regulator transcription factor [unclassified Variovorax]|uniref:response regulator transcription factor n=1 Tax=unclassified Variovorax TaxID=663243 RepID=UPI000883695F|nr:response regulator transcription factor [Variovorax sp. CF079]SDC05617.1 Response regulator receiver domain-containing protein [Variovorax sp. CF079]
MNLPTTKQASVLVVEDDENIAYLLKFMLEREQYKVALARDGRKAKEFIEAQSPPHIALLDVMLPFVDGFELIRLIRGSITWRSVPILMLSAKAQEQDVVRALDAGANDYVQKPFAPNELLARVRRYAKAPS